MSSNGKTILTSHQHGNQKKICNKTWSCLPAGPTPKQGDRADQVAYPTQLGDQPVREAGNLKHKDPGPAYLWTARKVHTNTTTGLKRDESMHPLVVNEDIVLDEGENAETLNSYFSSQTDININTRHQKKLSEFRSSAIKTPHTFIFTPFTTEKC